jgi:radical SAM superfamily enzyme YgiQ (UPF0313 family)
LRVLILEPPNQLAPDDRAFTNGNLGAAYIVAALRQAGVETDYLDATVGFPGDDLQESFYRRTPMENGNVRVGLSRERLADIISKYDIVATTSSFTLQTRMHFEIAEIVRQVEKENGQRILTISGGVNARSLREHFLGAGFDAVAMGDGEKTVVQFVESVASGAPDFKQVERIAFLDQGRVVLTGAKPAPATKFIDDVPPPAIDALPLEVYRRIGISPSGYPLPGTMFGSLQTSRGCQDACTFCHISLEKEQREEFGNIGFLRMFSNERVSDDVTNAYNHGVRRLYIHDDNFFFNKKRIFRLSNLIKREGLKYSNVTGANLRFLFVKTPHGYEPDTEFIAALAELGLDELSLPFESSSQEMMKKYMTNKYDPNAMNPVAVLKAVKAAGIRPISNFLIGFRDESWESVLKTKEYAKFLFSEGLDSAGFSVPVPYPGCVDFAFEMRDPARKVDFDANLLSYTDRMHFRGRPLFNTRVPGEKLHAAVKEFWLELNPKAYTNASQSMRVESGGQEKGFPGGLH